MLTIPIDVTRIVLVVDPRPTRGGKGLTALQEAVRWLKPIFGPASVVRIDNKELPELDLSKLVHTKKHGNLVVSFCDAPTLSRFAFLTGGCGNCESDVQIGPKQGFAFMMGPRGHILKTVRFAPPTMGLGG